MTKYRGGLKFGTTGRQGGGNTDAFPMHNGVAPGPMYRSPVKQDYGWAVTDDKTRDIIAPDNDNKVVKKKQSAADVSLERESSKKVRVATPKELRKKHRKEGNRITGKERRAAGETLTSRTAAIDEKEIAASKKFKQGIVKGIKKGIKGIDDFAENRLAYMKSEEGRATSDIVNKMANMFRPERYGKLPTDQANQQRNALRTDLLNEQKQIELDDYRKSKLGENDMKTTQSASTTPEGEQNLDKGYVSSTETSTAAKVHEGNANKTGEQVVNDIKNDTANKEEEKNILRT
tara:strand:+ start:48 stop:917 length:870 start_codon:yes stop_codon:yes gene_type:complete